jgi:tetratricopeptide (TPR) repeat protein
MTMNREQLTVNKANGKGDGMSGIMHKILLLILVLSLVIGVGIFILKRVQGNTTGTTTTGDIASLAAFVSVSPEVLDYSRYISGIAWDNRRTGHNRNFQYAIWLIEGLRAGGISQSDTSSGETQVQFPRETLSYRTGNSRDIALLYAAALQGADIPAAFIKTENDFLAAFSLGINASAAETLFNGTDKILIINDEVWLPLSMNAFNEGFTVAWTRASATLYELFKAKKNVDFVIVEEAWAVYPPAPMPELEGRSVPTDMAVATVAANRVNGAMIQYIEQELHQILRLVQTQINTNPTAALHNRVGILQARIGRMAEAKAAYERAAGMDSVPAMTNRGNLALIERDYQAAEQWFRLALYRDSENQAALWGLERVISNE